MTTRLQYTPLQIQKHPRTAITLTAESKHWKQFKQIHTQTLKNSVSTVSSNLNQLNTLFYSSGRELTIYSTQTKSIVKTMTNFNDNISTVCPRQDGKLFAVALESGSVHVIDIKNQLTLRRFMNHTKRVNALEYANVNELYSAGDDRIIRQYDVAANTVVHSFANAHQDYIKTMGYLYDNHIVTGGYDGKVRLFDFRTHKKHFAEFDHAFPVESLSIMPSKLSLASVGGTALKVWDIRTRKMLFQNLNNKKTLTCVRTLKDGDRILTSSLDQQLKIYNASSLEVTYQEKYQDTIVSFDVTSDSRHIGVGLNNGKVIIKGSNKEVVEESSDDDNNLPTAFRLDGQTTVAYNNSFFYRGIYSQPEQHHIVVQNISNKTGFYDQCLKKFQYKKALMSCIAKGEMHILQSLVDQLQQRGALERTLKHLESTEIRVFLKLATKRVNNQKYRDVLLQLLGMVFDMHSKTAASLQEWKDLLEAVDKEIYVERELVQELGVLETISNIASL